MNMKSSFESYLFITALVILLLLLFSNFTVVIFFFLAFFVVYRISGSNKRYILNSFIIGCIIVIGFYFYWLEFYGNEYYLGSFSDDYYYDKIWSEGFIDRYGINLFKLNEFLNGIEPNLGYLHNSKGYVAFIIILRYISSFLDGYHTMIPRIINILFLALSSYYCSKIAYHYTKKEEIRKPVFLSVFFNPVMIFNSSHVFRDTIVAFVIVYIFYLLMSNKSLIKYILVFFLIVILYYFRSAAAFTTIFVVLILSIRAKSIKKLIILSSLIFAIVVYFFLSDYVSILFQQADSYTQLNVERMGNLGSKIFSLPLIIGIVPRLIFLIFTPVPNLSSFHQFYISISAILQVIYFPFLFWGMLKNKINPSLMFTFLLLFMGIALSTATFRHVMMYLPFGITITVISYYTGTLKFASQKYLNTIFILFVVFGGSILFALNY